MATNGGFSFIFKVGPKLVSGKSDGGKLGVLLIRKNLETTTQKEQNFKIPLNGQLSQQRLEKPIFSDIGIYPTYSVCIFLPHSKVALSYDQSSSNFPLMLIPITSHVNFYGVQL